MEHIPIQKKKTIPPMSAQPNLIPYDTPPLPPSQSPLVTP